VELKLTLTGLQALSGLINFNAYCVLGGTGGVVPPSG